MKRRIQRDELITRIFSLSDEGVAFRNNWRTVVFAVVWLILSGITMILTIIGVTDRLHILVLIAMSFIKYVPLLVVVYGLARKMASQYLNDVFELEDENLASSFLEEVAFGYGREKITINEGKISEEDEKSPIILIGGPGKVQVNLGSVALLEKVNGEPEVIYPRKDVWKLGRFERIREIGKSDEVGKREYAIINLRDQFIHGLSVKSRTKDGIPIEAQGIKVIFSILRKQAESEEEAQSNSSKYLFDENAVRALVYGQTIITPEPTNQAGVSFPWNTSVIPLISSEMEKLITSRTLGEILATISQKEVDVLSNNDATIAQMRLEMTGQRTRLGGKEASAPKFQNRSEITAQFFDEAFKEKAASLGVSIEWIDVGTWQLPNPIILEKHKVALELSRKNASERNKVERSRKSYETKEIVNLIDDVVISNFEHASSGRSSSGRDVTNKELLKQMEKLMSQRPDLKNHFILDDEDEILDDEDGDGERFPAYRPEIENQIRQQISNKKDSTNTAREILKAFRKELINGKALIEKENRPEAEKQADLAKINKALYDIEHLTFHYLK